MFRRRRSTTAASLPLVPSPAPLRSDASLFAGHPLHRRRPVEIDGRSLLLRPVLPSDLLLLDDLIRRQSLRTRFQRFHAPVHELTAVQLAGLVEVDHHDRETLVIVEPGRRPRLVGLGQYATVADGAAELALLVDDAWQGRGLGRVLATAVAEAAREAGRTALVATVLSDNAAALHLLSSLGVPTVVSRGHGETELVVPLTSANTRAGTVPAAALAPTG